MKKANTNKHKKGRKAGSSLTHCRKCGKPLDSEDPKRQTAKHLDPIFTGECKECASERIVKLKWSKRTTEEIEKRALQLHRETKMIMNILNQRTGGKQK